MRHLLSLFLLALPLAAPAQTLTEAEALRLGLARSDLSDLERGALEAAEADAIAARLIPNPTLGYSRDRTKGATTSVEETWQLSQTFDLSGRRGLRRDAAERRVEATTAGNLARRAELVADIRRRFHEVLLKQETVQATEAWAHRFARVEGIVDKLARAGEASGYDRRRLARERQAAQARLATEQGELDRAQAQLTALTSSTARASGPLLPPPLPPLDTTLAKLEQRPDLRALSMRAEAATLENRAAARGWMPDVTLGAGPKRIDNGIGTETGVVFSLSIPLPVFDRQQPAEKRAAAEALQARAEHNLARARAEGDLRGLQAQTERLRAAAIDYRKQMDAVELLRIAEAAYQGGESTLLELLDAYRGALEAELTALDLEWKAREARIEYDLLTGGTNE